jgi:hypothetical protein
MGIPSGPNASLYFLCVHHIARRILIGDNLTSQEHLLSKSIFQVLFTVTYWIMSWFILSKEEEGNNLKKGCQLEAAALDFFHRAGWNMIQGASSLSVSVCIWCLAPRVSAVCVLLVSGV